MAVESVPGIRRCNKCGWLFVTPDVERIRRCKHCKRDDGTEPRSATVHMEGLGESFKQALQDQRVF